jgi:nicotinamidase-related amidase
VGTIQPTHSAFFSTTLDTLLDDLGVSTLVLTGIAGNKVLDVDVRTTTDLDLRALDARPHDVGSRRSA